MPIAPCCAFFASITSSEKDAIKASTIKVSVGTARSSPPFSAGSMRVLGGVSFAQRFGEARDEVTPAACLAGRRTEMFGGNRSGELDSLAGEAAERGRSQ